MNRNRTLRILVLAIVLFAGTVTTVYGAFSVSTTIIEPVHGYIVESSIWTNRRGMVRTSNGTLWVVYFDEQGTSLQQIYCEKSLNDGSTWIGRVQVSTQAGYDDYTDAEDPSIAVDSEDNIHIVWTQGGDDTTWYHNIRHRIRNGTTGAWGTIYVVSTLSGMNQHWHYNPSIAIDSTDAAYIVWSGARDGYYTDDYQIFANLWYGPGSYSGPTRISTQPQGGDGYDDQYMPHVEVDGYDNAQVVWHGESNVAPGANDQIWYSNFSLPGPSWKGPTDISNASGMDSYPQMQAVIVTKGAYFAGSITLIAAWRGNTGDGEGYEVYVSTRTAAGWSTAHRATETSQQIQYPSLAVDLDGKILLVYMDGSLVMPHSPPNNIFMAVSGSNGASWYNEQKIEGGASDKFHSARLLWSRYPSWNNQTVSKRIYVRQTITGNDLADVVFVDFTPILPAFYCWQLRLGLLFFGLGAIFLPLMYIGTQKPDAIIVIRLIVVMIIGFALLMCSGGLECVD